MAWLAALGRPQRPWGPMNDEKTLGSRDSGKGDGTEFLALPGGVARKIHCKQITQRLSVFGERPRLSRKQVYTLE